MSAATNYTLPQTLVHQRITPQVRVSVEDLQSVIVGPNFALRRYGVAEEKVQIGIGQYKSGQELSSGWPGRPVGATVDLDWATVFADKAYFRYWSSIGTINLVTGTRNQIRSDDTIWADYGKHEITDNLPPRGVKEGDGVRVIVPAASVDVLTQVVGFEHDEIQAQVKPVEVVDTNKPDSPAAATAEYSFGGTGKAPQIDVGTVTYDPSSLGLAEDVYTVTCIAGPDSSDPDPDSTVLFRIDSASGKDNVASVGLTGGGFDTLAVGTMGISVTFTKPDADEEFSVDQTYIVRAAAAFSQPTVTSGGTYAGSYDTTYIVRVTKGGLIGDATNPPVIEIAADNGVDRGLPYNVTAGAVLIGSYGTTITFSGTSLATGDQYLIPVVARQSGALHTLILAHSLPVEVTDAMPIQIELMAVKDGVELDENRRNEPPLKNFKKEAAKITVNPTVTYYDPEFVDRQGEQIRMHLYTGEIFAQYRAILQTYSHAVHEIRPEAANGLSSVLGEISPDNPLAFGVWMALQNAAVENGVSVLYCAVQSNDLAGYRTALGKLTGRVGAYGLVPLTQDPLVHAEFRQHVNSMSLAENGRWRVCWLNSENPEQLGVFVGPDADPFMASIYEDPSDHGEIKTLECEAGQFITKGVRAGDIVRYNYRSDGFDDTWTWDENVVDRVISENVLKLYNAADRETVTPVKIEIHRNLSSREMAEAYAKISGSFYDRRVRHIWPALATIQGAEVPGYFLCCGLAALRASVSPQQGLTNQQLNGVDSVAWSTDYMEAEDLNVMAASGTWIVTQNPSTGLVYTRHQLTTGQYGSLDEQEDSLVTNMDSVSYQLLRAFEFYTGKINLTQMSLSQLKAELILVMSTMQTALDPMLGPQVVDWVLVRFEKHPYFRGRAIAEINFTGPEPFNNFDLYLVTGTGSVSSESNVTLTDANPIG